MKTLFFSFGIILTAFAFIVSFVGLRLKRLPTGPLFAIVVLIFVVLVAGTATFAVGYSRQEQADRKARLAAENITPALDQQGNPGGDESSGSSSADEVVKGPGATVQLAASPTELAFDKPKLTSKPGKVTIELTNPSSTPHNIGIIKGQKRLGVSETVASSTTSVSASLSPGTYTFLCTVTGHAEAGMTGTLTVK